MTLKKISLAAFAAALLVTPAAAQEVRDEIVVVGTLVPLDATDLGASVSVFDADELGLRKADFLSSLLREVPSLAVSRTGPVGAFTQLRLRGSEADHTLTLFDGMEISDPALDGQVDFAALTGFDIGRMEVLRGAGSAMYGSDALGGVVSLSTPTPTSESELSAELRTGSQQTWAGGAALSGAVAENVVARGSVSHFRTEGVNAARLGNEKDGHRVTSANGKLLADLAPATSLELVGRYSQTHTETDDQDFDCTFDPMTWACPPTNPATYGRAIDTDNVSKVRSYQGRAVLVHEFAPDWVGQAAVEASRSRARHYDMGVLSRATRGAREKYSGQLTRQWGEHTLTGAIVHERQSFENMSPAQDRTRKTTSYMAEAQVLPSENTALQLGVRHDDNDVFEDFTSWRASGTYALPDMPYVLHASAGTGVKDPGFFELFGYDPSSFVGNPALKPESALTREAGVSGMWHDGALQADVTAFRSEVKDRVITVFSVYPFTADNEAGTAVTTGLELSARAEFEGGAAAMFSYSNVDARNSAGRRALRRAEHLGSVSLSAPICEGRGNAALTGTYNGKQWDNDFTTSAAADGRVELDAYWLVSFAADYALSDRASVFLRGENLLDEDYTEVFTYSSTGRSVFIGLRTSLGN